MKSPVRYLPEPVLAAPMILTLFLTCSPIDLHYLMYRVKRSACGHKVNFGEDSFLLIHHDGLGAQRADVDADIRLYRFGRLCEQIAEERNLSAAAKPASRAVLCEGHFEAMNPAD